MTKNRIARPGSLNIFIELMTHYCQIVFRNDFQFTLPEIMQESANFTIPSPALSITMFLLLFAILTCEAHLIFAAREAEPVLCLLDVNNFFGSASLQH